MRVQNVCGDKTRATTNESTNVWGDKTKVRRRQRRQNKTTSRTVKLVIKKKRFAMHQWLRYLARAIMNFFHEPFAVWP
jgi:hypothetical protein